MDKQFYSNFLLDKQTKSLSENDQRVIADSLLKTSA